MGVEVKDGGDGEGARIEDEVLWVEKMKEGGRGRQLVMRGW